MEEEYNAERFAPKADTTWLIWAICSQQLQNSRGRPKMFEGKPPKQNSTGTQTPASNNRNANTGQCSQNKISNQVKQERKLPADFIKAHEEFTAKTSKKMTIANICKGLDISDTSKLATALGLDASKDCFCIHLLGTCPGCPRNHTINTNFKREEALEALKKATVV